MKYLENEKDFNELIKEGKVLVDFYADWCGPCKMIGPVLEEIASENSDVEIVKVNVDNFENIARSYGIMSIPTLIVFKNGKETNKSIGFVDKNSILELLK
ncbi:MAG: thioredoxin [Firmicutes bacterium]|nr:thioredoxin [Bacillota bacterium]